MARIERGICVLLSLCMLGGLLVYAPFLLGLPVKAVDMRYPESLLPYFRYQSRQQHSRSIIEDEQTYEAIVEANQTYLKEQVAEENAGNVENAEGIPTQKAETPVETTLQPTGEPSTQVAARTPVQEITREELENYDILLNRFFIVDGGTATNAKQINAAVLLDRDMHIADSDGAQILIYHSHSQEGFADSVAGDPATTVVGVGEYLTQLLTEDYGYQVIHVTDTFDVINGEIDRNSAYDYARARVEQVLAENPSVEVVIDLHRDGVPETKHLVTEIDGRPTAQIMFFNGLSYSAMNGVIEYLPNPYISDNLAFSFQLQLVSEEYFGNLNRPIYLSSLRYNLHLRPRALLLEVGAQNNTVEEARNAMIPFAWILNHVLKQ